jgi:hypothetical protein
MMKITEIKVDHQTDPVLTDQKNPVFSYMTVSDHPENALKKA